MTLLSASALWQIRCFLHSLLLGWFVSRITQCATDQFLKYNCDGGNKMATFDFKIEPGFKQEKFCALSCDIFTTNMYNYIFFNLTQLTPEFRHIKKGLKVEFKSTDWTFNAHHEQWGNNTTHSIAIGTQWVLLVLPWVPGAGPVRTAGWRRPGPERHPTHVSAGSFHQATASYTCGTATNKQTNLSQRPNITSEA